MAAMLFGQTLAKSIAAMGRSYEDPGIASSGGTGPQALRGA